MTESAVPRRDRLRRQAIDDAKRIALRQLAERGAGAISLNAIAREMGMTGPALYRYVPNRDALLTDLVVDAYAELGDAVWRSVETTAGQGPATRLRHQAAAYRLWALEHPHRYMLIFGTPVPGYHAPAERTGPAAHRILAAAVILMAEVAPASWPETTDPFEIELERWAAATGIPPMPGSLVRQVLTGWTRPHGVLSLEIEGHFAMGLPDPAGLYEAEVDALVRELHDVIG